MEPRDDVVDEVVERGPSTAPQTVTVVEDADQRSRAGARLADDAEALRDPALEEP